MSEPNPPPEAPPSNETPPKADDGPIDADLLWNEVRTNREGLVPCLTQDAQSRAVLMLAWVNKEALKNTLTTGWATYWSRSRQAIWTKGEGSGNRQQIVQIRLDCDGDTLLYVVEPEGPACHYGYDTCFFRRRIGNGWAKEPEAVLGQSVVGQSAGAVERLERVIELRRVPAGDGKRSRTQRLLAGGLPVQGAQLKAGAEAFVHALGAKRKHEVADAAAELVYDLAVALRGRKIALADVLVALERQIRTADEPGEPEG